MTATAPTRRTGKLLPPLRLRRRPAPRPVSDSPAGPGATAPDAPGPTTPADPGPTTPDVWLAGLRLGS